MRRRIRCDFPSRQCNALMNPAYDLASRTDTLIQRIGILDIVRVTLLAVGKIEFVVLRNALQQVPCPFETQLWLLVKQQVGFISAAETMAKFNIGARPTWVYAIILINAYQEPCGK